MAIPIGDDLDCPAICIFNQEDYHGAVDDLKGALVRDPKIQTKFKAFSSNILFFLVFDLVVMIFLIRFEVSIFQLKHSCVQW